MVLRIYTLGGARKPSGARAVEIEESRADLDQRGTEHSKPETKN